MSGYWVVGVVGIATASRYRGVAGDAGQATPVMAGVTSGKSISLTGAGVASTGCPTGTPSRWPGDSVSAGSGALMTCATVAPRVSRPPVASRNSYACPSTMAEVTFTVNSISV